MWLLFEGQDYIYTRGGARDSIMYSDNNNTLRQRICSLYTSI